MRRVVVSLFSVVVVGVFAAACDDGYDRHHHRHGKHRREACTVQPSCGECTPVLGCGWCFTEMGGVCVSNPDACPRGSLGFTWDPPGCSSSEAGAAAFDNDADSIQDASVDVERVLADVRVDPSDGE